jgi:arabinose-5-phosphate isomerase
LLLRVADVMQRADEVPLVTPDATLAEALFEMTKKGLGMTTIADKDGKLLGVFTDGDLRRVVEDQADLKNTPLSEVMTPGARVVKEDLLAAEAMSMMERHQISTLVIVNETHHIEGVVTLLALLKAGIS